MMQTSILEHRRTRIEFENLTHDEQVAAVRRMADEGHGDYSISGATCWAVEEIRRVLGERRAARAQKRKLVALSLYEQNAGAG